MNKKKETEKERQEYLQERKVYIEWMRQSSQEFQKYMLLVATWWFAYSLSFYKSATCPLKISRILFWLIVIINIFSYYFSSLANEAYLEWYDTKNKEEKENFEKSAKKRNNCINSCSITSLILMVFGIVLFAIFFLVV